MKILKAFKTQDRMGNGKADEIPLIGSKTAGIRGLQDSHANITLFVHE